MILQVRDMETASEQVSESAAGGTAARVIRVAAGDVAWTFAHLKGEDWAKMFTDVTTNVY